MRPDEDLIPPHGGFRQLKSFQIARFIYDVTVRFCELYIDGRSRTRDQMVQAARSGVQNIAEGSQASATSKRTELKLTNVARASLEELRLDYEDFLRQRGFPQWPADHPALVRFKKRRGAKLDDVRSWIEAERQLAHAIDQASSSVPVGDGPCRSGSLRSETPILVANAVLSLLNLCTHLLDRQLRAQAEAFKEVGGFTERLYRVRTNRRNSR